VRDPPRWPRRRPSIHKSWHYISSISGGRSVGRVRSGTKGHGVCLSDSYSNWKYEYSSFIGGGGGMGGMSRRHVMHPTEIFTSSGWSCNQHEMQTNKLPPPPPTHTHTHTQLSSSGPSNTSIRRREKCGLKENRYLILKINPQKTSSNFTQLFWDKATLLLSR
jgi:hypothetical protein